MDTVLKRSRVVRVAVMARSLCWRQIMRAQMDVRRFQCVCREHRSIAAIRM